MLNGIFNFFERISVCVEISRVASYDVDKAREMMQKEFC